MFPNNFHVGLICPNSPRIKSYDPGS